MRACDTLRRMDTIATRHRRVSLSLESDLLDRMRENATAANRSLSQEVEFHLRRIVSGRPARTLDDLLATVDLNRGAR